MRVSIPQATLDPQGIGAKGIDASLLSLRYSTLRAVLHSLSESPSRMEAQVPIAVTETGRTVMLTFSTFLFHSY